MSLFASRSAGGPRYCRGYGSEIAGCGLKRGGECVPIDLSYMQSTRSRRDLGRMILLGSCIHFGIGGHSPMLSRASCSLRRRPFAPPYYIEIEGCSERPLPTISVIHVAAQSAARHRSLVVVTQRTAVPRAPSTLDRGLGLGGR